MKNFFFFIVTAFLLTAPSVAQSQTGLAKVYDDEFHGRKTAFGEFYDKSKFTAAHKKHPYGTLLRVTRLDNQKSVNVKVNDKGPYVTGYVIDLSRAAANALGISDFAEVKVEVVGRSDAQPGIVSRGNTNSTNNSTANNSSSTNNNSTATTTPPQTSARTYDIRVEPDEGSSNPQTTTTTPPANANRNNTASTNTNRRNAVQNPTNTTRNNSPSTPPSTITTPRSVSSSVASAPDRERMVGKDYEKYGLYQIMLMQPQTKGYGVQVMSLSNYENVLQQVADYQARSFDQIYLSIEPGDFGRPVYKIILGMFDNKSAAETYKS
ncbi:MAG: septal ring lytic transglycosylase RlpA family protein, partial [Bacteroidota bacterium]